MSTNAPISEALSDNTTKLNIPDIERFFQFLDSETEVFCYAFFDEYSKEVIKGHGVKFGILPEILDDVSQFATSNRFTLHTTLNSTNLSGRKRKDITRCRVLCVDFDRPIDRASLRPLVEANGVHLVVESSPNKYHFYWKIDSGTTLEEWSRLQLGFNHFFGADLNLAQPNHTIRVPGVSRVTKDGEVFMPSIVYAAANPISRCSAEFLADFLWLDGKISEAQTQQKSHKKMLNSTAQAIRHGHKINVEGIASANNRNETVYSVLYKLACDTSQDTSYAAICQYSLELNRALLNHPKGPLGTEELNKIVNSAYEHGVAKREAREKHKEEELERVLKGAQVYEHTNGHIAPVKFEYDYTARELAFSRFSDFSVIEMVGQRFKHHLVRVGRILYAFDEDFKVWRSQKHSKEILQGFIKDCLKDMREDPELIKERCTNDNGEVSTSKIKRELERLSSFRLGIVATNFLLDNKHIQRITLGDFDNNPDLFYAKNGVLNLATGEFREARATDMLLRQAPVTFDPNAKCPYFEKFISEIYAKNQAPTEVIRFIQELFGYSLTGSIAEQTVFIHVGDGANGKSRVLGALGALMGDYCTRVEPNTLTKNKNSVGKEVSRLGAKIEGKRLMIIDDLDTRSQWEDSLIKMLTDSTITARLLYEEERDIPNHAKIHIGCNQTPNVENPGKAMDRRICIIEYPRTFEPSPSKLKEITQAIEHELSGILNWAIEGYRRIESYADKKTKWAQEVYSRVEEYQEANAHQELDVLALFKSDSSLTEKHSLDEIVEHVERWYREQGAQNRLGRDKIGQLLRKHGFKGERSRSRGPKITFYYLTFKKFDPLEKLSAPNL